MASVKEVNSFVFKFNQLWNSGFAADLNFKCYAGQAFATLHVGLGYSENVVTASSGTHNLKSPKHVSPSQLRRRVRRENARKCNGNLSAETEKVVDDDVKKFESL